MQIFCFKVEKTNFIAKFVKNKLFRLSILKNAPNSDCMKKTNENVEKLKIFLEKFLKGEDVSYRGEIYLLSTKKEQMVLNECKNIKKGETISYKELADRCGIKNGARFVGNALSKNRLPIVIPCHRVIKSNGKLGKYNLGEEYKLKFIQIERGKINGYN